MKKVFYPFVRLLSASTNLVNKLLRIKDTNEDKLTEREIISVISKGRSEGIIDYNEEIINASSYPDVQELLTLSDTVITDYSSLMFDFALSKKPCFIFASDIANYQKERNFYFEIDKMPFPVSV